MRWRWWRGDRLGHLGRRRAGLRGGNLSCGMAALSGAISSVRIEHDRVRTEVIGNVLPLGICGSGVMEAITQLVQHGILEPGGRLRRTAAGPTSTWPAGLSAMTVKTLLSFTAMPNGCCS